MSEEQSISHPLIFNPLKHHLDYIKQYISGAPSSDTYINYNLIPSLKHLGSSVADIYKGKLSVKQVQKEILDYICKLKLEEKNDFRKWISSANNEYRKCILSDESSWVIKFLDENPCYIHLFPGRNANLTVRSRGNSLKTAILYNILFNKEDIILSNLNHTRLMLGLSPVRCTDSSSSLIRDILLLRN